MGKAMMGTGEAEGEGRAAKAAEMAIINQLIDDYTLSAKGLLANITLAKILNFWVEAVNKVRAEVIEAELIIGAITDPTLEGIMKFLLLQQL